MSAVNLAEKLSTFSDYWSPKIVSDFNGHKVGRLFMYVEGRKPDPFADWCGSWSVIDGTGELTNLRGRGDWWGPGYNLAYPDVWGTICYDGKIK